MQLVAVPLAISLLKYVIFLINHYRLQKKTKAGIATNCCWEQLLKLSS